MKKISTLILLALLSIFTVGSVFAVETSVPSSEIKNIIQGLSSSSLQEILDQNKRTAPTSTTTVTGGLSTTSISDKVQNLGIDQNTNVVETVLRIVQNLFSFLGIVAVLLLIAEGAALILARGDTDRRKKVVATIVNIALGFGLIIVSWALVTFIITVISGKPEDIQKQLNEAMTTAPNVVDSNSAVPECPPGTPITQICSEKIKVSVGEPRDLKFLFLKINNQLIPTTAPITVTESEWSALDASFVMQVSSSAPVTGSVQVGLISNGAVSGSAMPANAVPQSISVTPVQNGSLYQFEIPLTTSQKDQISKGCKSPNTLYLLPHLTGFIVQSNDPYRIPLSIRMAGEENIVCSTAAVGQNPNGSITPITNPKGTTFSASGYDNRTHVSYVVHINGSGVTEKSYTSGSNININPENEQKTVALEFKIADTNVPPADVTFTHYLRYSSGEVISVDAKNNIFPVQVPINSTVTVVDIISAKDKAGNLFDLGTNTISFLNNATPVTVHNSAAAQTTAFIKDPRTNKVSTVSPNQTYTFTKFENEPKLELPLSLYYYSTIKPERIVVRSEAAPDTPFVFNADQIVVDPSGDKKIGTLSPYTTVTLPVLPLASYGSYPITIEYHSRTLGIILAQMTFTIQVVPDGTDMRLSLTGPFAVGNTVSVSTMPTYSESKTLKTKKLELFRRDKDKDILIKSVSVVTGEDNPSFLLDTDGDFVFRLTNTFEGKDTPTVVEKVIVVFPPEPVASFDVVEDSSNPMRFQIIDASKNVGNGGYRRIDILPKDPNVKLSEWSENSAKQLVQTIEFSKPSGYRITMMAYNIFGLADEYSKDVLVRTNVAANVLFKTVVDDDYKEKNSVTSPVNEEISMLAKASNADRVDMFVDGALVGRSATSTVVDNMQEFTVKFIPSIIGQKNLEVKIYGKNDKDGEPSVSRSFDLSVREKLSPLANYKVMGTNELTSTGRMCQVGSGLTNGYMVNTLDDYTFDASSTKTSFDLDVNTSDSTNTYMWKVSGVKQLGNSYSLKYRFSDVTKEKALCIPVELTFTEKTASGDKTSVVTKYFFVQNSKPRIESFVAQWPDGTLKTPLNVMATLKGLQDPDKPNDKLETIFYYIIDKNELAFEQTDVNNRLIKINSFGEEGSVHEVRLAAKVKDANTGQYEVFMSDPRNVTTEGAKGILLDIISPKMSGGLTYIPWAVNAKNALPVTAELRQSSGELAAGQDITWTLQRTGRVSGCNLEPEASPRQVQLSKQTTYNFTTLSCGSFTITASITYQGQARNKSLKVLVYPDRETMSKEEQTVFDGFNKTTVAETTLPVTSITPVGTTPVVLKPSASTPSTPIAGTFTEVFEKLENATYSPLEILTKVKQDQPDVGVRIDALKSTGISDSQIITTLKQENPAVSIDTNKPVDVVFTTYYDYNHNLGSSDKQILAIAGASNPNIQSQIDQLKKDGKSDSEIVTLLQETSKDTLPLANNELVQIKIGTKASQLKEQGMSDTSVIASLKASSPEAAAKIQDLETKNTPATEILAILAKDDLDVTTSIGEALSIKSDELILSLRSRGLTEDLIKRKLIDDNPTLANEIRSKDLKTLPTVADTLQFRPYMPLRATFQEIFDVYKNYGWSEKIVYRKMAEDDSDFASALQLLEKKEAGFAEYYGVFAKDPNLINLAMHFETPVVLTWGVLDLELQSIGIPSEIRYQIVSNENPNFAETFSDLRNKGNTYYQIFTLFSKNLAEKRVRFSPHKGVAVPIDQAISYLQSSGMSDAMLLSHLSFTNSDIGNLVSSLKEKNILATDMLPVVKERLSSGKVLLHIARGSYQKVSEIVRSLDAMHMSLSLEKAFIATILYTKVADDSIISGTALAKKYEDIDVMLLPRTLSTSSFSALFPVYYQKTRSVSAAFAAISEYDKRFEREVEILKGQGFDENQIMSQIQTKSFAKNIYFAPFAPLVLSFSDAYNMYAKKNMSPAIVVTLLSEMKKELKDYFTTNVDPKGISQSVINQLSKDKAFTYIPVNENAQAMMNPMDILTWLTSLGFTDETILSMLSSQDVGFSAFVKQIDIKGMSAKAVLDMYVRGSTAQPTLEKSTPSFYGFSSSILAGTSEIKKTSDAKISITSEFSSQVQIEEALLYLENAGLSKDLIHRFLLHSDPSIIGNDTIFVQGGQIIFDPFTILKAPYNEVREYYISRGLSPRMAYYMLAANDLKVQENLQRLTSQNLSSLDIDESLLSTFDGVDIDFSPFVGARIGLSELQDALSEMGLSQNVITAKIKNDNPILDSISVIKDENPTVLFILNNLLPFDPLLSKSLSSTYSLSTTATGTTMSVPPKNEQSLELFLSKLDEQKITPVQTISNLKNTSDLWNILLKDVDPALMTTNIELLSKIPRNFEPKIISTLTAPATLKGSNFITFTIRLGADIKKLVAYIPGLSQGTYYDEVSTSIDNYSAPFPQRRILTTYNNALVQLHNIHSSYEYLARQGDSLPVITDKVITVFSEEGLKSSAETKKPLEGYGILDKVALFGCHTFARIVGDDDEAHIACNGYGIYTSDILTIKDLLVAGVGEDVYSKVFSNDLAALEEKKTPQEKTVILVSIRENIRQSSMDSNKKDELLRRLTYFSVETIDEETMKRYVKEGLEELLTKLTLVVNEAEQEGGMRLGKYVTDLERLSYSAGSAQVALRDLLSVFDHIDKEKILKRENILNITTILRDNLTLSFTNIEGLIRQTVTNKDEGDAMLSIITQAKKDIANENNIQKIISVAKVYGNISISPSFPEATRLDLMNGLDQLVKRVANAVNTTLKSGYGEVAKSQDTAIIAVQASITKFSSYTSILDAFIKLYANINSQPTLSVDIKAQLTATFDTAKLALIQVVSNAVDNSQLLPESEKQVIHDKLEGLVKYDFTEGFTRLKTILDSLYLRSDLVGNDLLHDMSLQMIDIIFQAVEKVSGSVPRDIRSDVLSKVGDVTLKKDFITISTNLYATIDQSNITKEAEVFASFETILLDRIGTVIQNTRAKDAPEYAVLKTALSTKIQTLADFSKAYIALGSFYEKLSVLGVGVKQRAQIGAHIESFLLDNVSHIQSLSIFNTKVSFEGIRTIMNTNLNVSLAKLITIEEAISRVSALKKTLLTLDALSLSRKLEMLYVTQHVFPLTDILSAGNACSWVYVKDPSVSITKVCAEQDLDPTKVEPIDRTQLFALIKTGVETIQPASLISDQSIVLAISSKLTSLYDESIKDVRDRNLIIRDILDILEDPRVTSDERNNFLSKIYSLPVLSDEFLNMQESTLDVSKVILSEGEVESSLRTVMLGIASMPDTTKAVMREMLMQVRDQYYNDRNRAYGLLSRSYEIVLSSDLESTRKQKILYVLSSLGPTNYGLDVKSLIPEVTLAKFEGSISNLPESEGKQKLQSLYEEIVGLLENGKRLEAVGTIESMKPLLESLSLSPEQSSDMVFDMFILSSFISYVQEEVTKLPPEPTIVPANPDETNPTVAQDASSTGSPFYITVFWWLVGAVFWLLVLVVGSGVLLFISFYIFKFIKKDQAQDFEEYILLLRNKVTGIFNKTETKAFKGEQEELNLPESPVVPMPVEASSQEISPNVEESIPTSPVKEEPKVSWLTIDQVDNANVPKEEVIPTPEVVQTPEWLTPSAGAQKPFTDNLVQTSTTLEQKAAADAEMYNDKAPANPDATTQGNSDTSKPVSVQKPNDSVQ